jgi:hypothetical protein
VPQFNLYPTITDPQEDDLLLIYQDSSGSLKTVTSESFAQLVGDIITSGAGAPSTAGYVISTPNIHLPNAQALAALDSGILMNATGSGLLTIADPGVDIVVPGSILVSGLTMAPASILGRSSAGPGAIEALTTIPAGISWEGDVLTGEFGGTGVDNTGKTITLSGDFATSGAFALTLILSNVTSLTLPTSGTLAVTASPVFTTQITTPKVVWSGAVIDLFGSGTPEGAITAAVGSVYRRTDGSSGTTLYLKESGSGNTGWVALGTGGSGTVTHTGNLTSNGVVLGNAAADTKVVAGIFTDGVSAITLGESGVSLGKLVLANATSGSISLQAETGALGTKVLTAPAKTGTISVEKSVNLQTGTSYILVLGDADQNISLANSNPIGLTIPTNASVPFPPGTTILIAQRGSGQVTVSGAGGVTLETSSSANKTSAQGAMAVLTYWGSDTWGMDGNVTA